ncbi:MAG: tetratricopeptide repeat protein [Chloroflexi bacterium]|nr:tetratricopeptide repeat protein [Chloroflexota bacterium]
MKDIAARQSSLAIWQWSVALLTALIATVAVWYGLTHFNIIGSLQSSTAASTAAPATNEASSPSQDFVDLGLERARTGDIEGALEALSVAIASDPDGAAQAYYYRALIQAQQGELPAAISDFDKAIEIDGHFPAAYAARATAKLSQGHPAKAIEDFNKALRLDDTHAPTYINRGQAYMQLKMYDEALLDFNHAIKLDSQSLAAYFNRGVFYLERQQNEKALADFNACVELDPSAPAPYFNRAVTYVQLGEKDKAIADLGMYLNLAQDEEGIHQAKALLEGLSSGYAEDETATGQDSP